MGSEFGIDPVAVLEERSPFRMAVRIAAFRAVQNERDRADRAANKGKGSTKPARRSRRPPRRR